MKGGLDRWLPRRIGGQIALLIVAASLCLHIGITTVFYLERSNPPPLRSGRS